MSSKVIIIGAGGHARVIADIVLKNNDELLGFLDDNISEGKNIIEKYKVLGKIDKSIEIYKKDKSIKFIIGIGDNYIRKKIANEYDISYYTAIHPSSVIGLGVKINEGTCIMANAVINVNSNIGKHCIINTNSVIEHDNIINDYVHISPTATLAGNVLIGENDHIGVGAVVKNNISIGKNIIIGAGAVVVKNINQEGIYIGVPAKIKKEKI